MPEFLTAQSTSSPIQGIDLSIVSNPVVNPIAFTSVTPTVQASNPAAPSDFVSAILNTEQNNDPFVSAFGVTDYTGGNTGVAGGSSGIGADPGESTTPGWKTGVRDWLQDFMPSLETNVQFDYKKIALVLCGVTVFIALIWKMTSKSRR